MTQNKAKRPSIPTFEDTTVFHGHACPGLALGYRVAVAAMHRLRADRAEDEDLVAVVENDACGVDAVQFICGCTFGKGNLVFRDHGKHVYTFFNRATGRGFRIYAEPPEPPASETAMPATAPEPNAPQPGPRDASRKERIARLLSLPEEALLRIDPVCEPPPSRARIHTSSRCAACGERMMKTRARACAGQTLCIPCARRAAAPRDA